MSGSRSSACRSSTTPLIRVPSTSWPDASTGVPRVPPSRVRHAPVASKFSSASPAGSIIRWQLAQAGLRRCCSMRSRTDFGLAAPASSSNGGTTSGGGGGGVPSTFSSTHLPRSTGDVRWACEVTSRIAPLPSSPLRVSSASVTRRKWLP